MSNSDDERRRTIEALLAFAAELRKQGLADDQIAAALQEKGLDAEFANSVIARLDEAASEEEASSFTGAGCLVVVLAVVFTFTAGLYFAMWLYKVLPAGRYPAILLAIPVVLSGILFFAVASTVCRRLGIPLDSDQVKAKESSTKP